MRNVKPKKYLGQHFLNDENIARKVVDSLSLCNYLNVLEIGPRHFFHSSFMLSLHGIFTLCITLFAKPYINKALASFSGIPLDFR